MTRRQVSMFVIFERSLLSSVNFTISKYGG
jgi:hypothetical protein